MPVRTSEATWRGSLRDGDGDFVVGDGVLSGAYTFVSRFEDGEEGKTNPEELIGAAHAACFSMALSAELDRADYEVEEVHTEATVHLGDDQIDAIELTAAADVPGIDDVEFQEIAAGAKEGCPISQTLINGLDISLDATLE